MDRSFPSRYAEPGPLTVLSAGQVAMVRALGLDREGLCRAAQGLIVAPNDAFGAGLSEAHLAQRNTRPMAVLLAHALELDGSPLGQPRPVEHRVVGTCRHDAVLATALLRANGVPARARCGFASYFVPSKHVDHWIVEHWSADARRWVRVDPEILDGDLVARPADLQPGEFLTGGEAWQLVRRGAADAGDFGVAGTDNWGPGEIRGNALRDLAALHKVEMLPWDEWGPMTASYAGTTDETFDASIDDLAAACAADDPAALAALYERYPVPADLIH